MEGKYKFTQSRHLYNQEDFEFNYGKDPVSGPSTKERFRCTRKKLWNFVTSYIPILKFIVKYRFKDSVVGDLLSGLNVSFMHLPQAMGFGILAGLQPIYGLYTTFFPVLFYAIFGTSPHISFGTNAVMALLTQNVVARELDIYKSSSSLQNGSITSGAIFNRPINGSEFSNMSSKGNNEILEMEYLNIKVGAAMTSSLIVGMMLSGMGILRLGFLTTYLSVSFIGGFTTAAAVHIASSQIPKALGIKVGRHSGAGRLIKMYIYLFSNITLIKVPEVIITAVCFVVLLLIKVCINERFRTRMKIPIPIDLLVVIAGTIISHFANFGSTFGVSIVGDVPMGIPGPILPSLNGASRIAMDCFVMAILSLTMSISMAKLIAGQKGIQINDNQEILAYGLSHIGSSFFFCFPQATAPPRTMILATMGAKTTLNAVTTFIFMLLVLLWIGQLFTSLPISVLAAMIIVSMKDLFLQLRDVPRIWKINKFDCLVWVITFLVSVFVDLDYGIICGVAVSIFFVVLQQQFTRGRLYGHSTEEDMIVELTNRKNVIEHPGIKIFRFESPLYFANAEIFKKQLYKLTVNPLEKKKKRLIQLNGNVNNAYQSNGYLNKPEGSVTADLHHIVIDFSMVSHIDMAGVKVLKQICKAYSEIKVKIYFARCSVRVIEVLEPAGFFDDFSKDNLFFDVIDAVNAASYVENEDDIRVSYITKL